MKTISLLSALTVAVCLVGCNSPEPGTRQQEKTYSESHADVSKAGLNIGGYPDRIQRYGHGFSEPEDFTPEEYDYIAKNYSIFTVEKRHAWGEYGPKPNTEAATIGTAKKLKAINPDIKVLLYWNIVLNWNFYESQTEFNKHPEWVFRNWVFQHANHDPIPMYDLNNPEVQEWWVNAIVDPVLRGDLDGVFLDAAPKVPKDQYENLFKIIDEVREKIGHDKIVIYNGYRVPDAATLQGGKEFIEHTTGVFIEFFLHSPLDTKEEAAFLFDNLIEAEKAGKMIIPRGSPNSVLPGTRQPFLFSFASFLLFYGPDSYYIYNSGYNKTQGMFQDYPEFDLSPGKAMGSAVRNGWVYTREFEKITVTVDLETNEAKIEPHAFTPVNDSSSAPKDLTIKESSFCKSLKPGKYILPAKEGWWNWGMAPIYDEDGKLHIFNSSIPYSGKWSRQSVINHYVADSVEGPYTLVETAFSSDSTTYHNPQISKVGDTCVLVFLRNPSAEDRSQSIGLATAKSLNGPWTESPHSPVIKPSRIPGSPNATHASNPTFLVDADGKFRIYYKSMSDRQNNRRTISLAIADKIEGPYVDHPDNPLISYEDIGLDVEDPYAFYYQGTYYMIVEDRMDVRAALEGATPSGRTRAGGNRPGLLYTSKDGITWDRPEIGYNTNSYYFNKKLSRTERPHILWKDGKPEYLFLADHGSREAGFYLKIENWK